MKSAFFVFLVVAATTLAGSTIIETEQVKELKPNGTLGSCGYKPTTAEQTYFSKVSKAEKTTGSFMQPYSIHNKKDTDVAWFAVVRGITPNPEATDRYMLLLEEKSFDGLSDCHIMMVSISGGGDFYANVEANDAKSIPLLSLVRVYGKVIKEENGVPTVAADYVRVWPWFTFTFTDLGPGDEGNPKWRKLCKPCKPGHVYKPYPTGNYYLDILGNPKDFAVQSKPPK